MTLKYLPKPSKLLLLAAKTSSHWRLDPPPRPPPQKREISKPNVNQRGVHVTSLATLKTNKGGRLRVRIPAGVESSATLRQGTNNSSSGLLSLLTPHTAALLLLYLVVGPDARAGLGYPSTPFSLPPSFPKSSIHNLHFCVCVRMSHES